MFSIGGGGQVFPILLSFSKRELEIYNAYSGKSAEERKEAHKLITKEIWEQIAKVKTMWPEIEGNIFPNLDRSIVESIAKKTELDIAPCEEDKKEGQFSPLDIFNYIYAILHDPKYRAKYRAFLKGDFPRIPYPKNKTSFWKLVEIGNQLRRLHLMDDEVIGETPYSFVDIRVNNTGSDEVTKPKHDGEHVWINDDKRFENVPTEAWEFYIGGYQPAQKWLKDRKGRDLSYEDVTHYQKIIKILCETHRIMDSY